MDYYNLLKIAPDYYGPGQHGKFFFFSWHRYTNKPRDTCNQGSAWVFQLEDAKSEAKKLSDEGEGDYSVVECPPFIQQDLRCVFA